MHFQPPSAEFLSEMIRDNVAKDLAPLDLSGIPRSVLEKVAHHAAMASVLGEDTPRVEISVGPDENYQHTVTGISSIATTMANVFYQDGADWYSVCLSGTGDIYELIALKLIDDGSDEWEIVGLDENDSDLLEKLSMDTLSYLGIEAIIARSSL